jgi:hypothetical protein
MFCCSPSERSKLEMCTHFGGFCPKVSVLRSKRMSFKSPTSNKHVGAAVVIVVIAGGRMTFAQPRVAWISSVFTAPHILTCHSGCFAREVADIVSAAAASWFTEPFRRRRRRASRLASTECATTMTSTTTTTAAVVVVVGQWSVVVAAVAAVSWLLLVWWWW